MGRRLLNLVDANRSYTQVLEENEDETGKVVASYTYKVCLEN
ncbi:hypothetical protein [Okeania sp. KiyG1]|nr:hypothetical protein [Okeania sp. KiyG1]